MGELIDKAKGKLKQAEGRLTGNRVREAEGVLDETKGKAKEKLEEAKHRVREALDERRNPDRKDT